MKHFYELRLATVALSAAVMLPFNPVFAQDAATPPPAPVPDVVVTTPPLASPPVDPPSTPVIPDTGPLLSEPIILPETPAPASAPNEARRTVTDRATDRSVSPTVRRVSRPAPASGPSASEAATDPGAESPARSAAAEAPASEVPATGVQPLPASNLPVTPLPVETAPAETGGSQYSGLGYWPWLIGAALLAGLVGALALRRRRRRRLDDDYRTAEFQNDYEAPDPFAGSDPIVDEDARVADLPPTLPAAPIIAPAAASMAVTAVHGEDESGGGTIGEIEAASVTEPQAEDLAAATAGAEPVADRPWLELLMRPIRAGTTGEETRVEFELTVANAGAVPAEDVRISSWMFAAGSAQETEMERMLIEPPTDARLGELDIPAGQGAKVEASIALPLESSAGEVLPVVVADARYRLPDGGEGRISASFAVGHAAGGDIEPFAVDQPSGLEETIDSRLFGEVHRA